MAEGGLVSQSNKIPAELGEELGISSMSEDELAAVESLLVQAGVLQQTSSEDELIDIGLETDSKKVSVPSLKIRQRMTTDESCPSETPLGGFFLTSGEEIKPPFKAMPLLMWVEHTKWSEEEGGIECRSPDGRTGTVYGKCSGCDHEPWKNNVRTSCKKSLNTILLSEDLKLVTVRFQGSSYRTGSGLGRAVGSRPVPWDKYVVLDTEKRTNKRGEYYVFVYRPSSEAPEENTRVLAKKVCLGLAEARKEALRDFHDRLAGVEIKEGVVRVDLDDDPEY